MIGNYQKENTNMTGSSRKDCRIGTSEKVFGRRRSCEKDVTYLVLCGFSYMMIQKFPSWNYCHFLAIWLEKNWNIAKGSISSTFSHIARISPDFINWYLHVITPRILTDSFELYRNLLTFYLWTLQLSELFVNLNLPLSLPCSVIGQ